MLAPPPITRIPDASAPDTHTRGPTYCDGDAWWPNSGYCAACGTPEMAASRYGWFCSPACRKEWRTNHVWQDARRAAIKAQRRCTTCGAGPGAPKGTRIEVNHIVARNGARLTETSCRNHQANLATLCVLCHRTETERQMRGAREA